MARMEFEHITGDLGMEPPVGLRGRTLEAENFLSIFVQKSGQNVHILKLPKPRSTNYMY